MGARSQHRRGQPRTGALEAKFEKNVGLLAEGFISKDQTTRRFARQARAVSRPVELQKQSYIEYEQKDREQMESDVARRARSRNVKAQNEIKLADKAADRAPAEPPRRPRPCTRRQAQAADRGVHHPRPVRRHGDYGTTIQQSRNRWSSDGSHDRAERLPQPALFSLPDTSKLVAEVRVHREPAGRIQKGIRVNVTVDAFRRLSLTGTVREIGVLAESGNWRDPNLREYTVKSSSTPTSTPKAQALDALRGEPTRYRQRR